MAETLRIETPNKMVVGDTEIPEVEVEIYRPGGEGRWTCRIQQVVFDTHQPIGVLYTCIDHAHVLAIRLNRGLGYEDDPDDPDYGV